MNEMGSVQGSEEGLSLCLMALVSRGNWLSIATMLLKDESRGVATRSNAPRRV
jgi:hypothetical protein